jgi:hypothetical protein
MAEAKARVRKFDESVTLTLKVDVRELRVRMAIGVWLIKLGCRVIGLCVKVEGLDVAKAASGV